tara:strand:+ start:33754 stop:33972 length:219 start_codon:yes stop_codon:yes gene_type:complete
MLGCCPVLCGSLCYLAFNGSHGEDKSDEERMEHTLSCCPCAVLYHLGCWLQPWNQNPSTYRIVTGRTAAMEE